MCKANQVSEKKRTRTQQHHHVKGGQGKNSVKETKEWPSGQEETQEHLSLGSWGEVPVETFGRGCLWRNGASGPLQKAIRREPELHWSLDEMSLFHVPSRCPHYGQRCHSCSSSQLLPHQRSQSAPKTKVDDSSPTTISNWE